MILVGILSLPLWPFTLFNRWLTRAVAAGIDSFNRRGDVS